MAKGEHHKKRGTREWKRVRKELFSVYGDVCWLCGHSGATDADHIVPLSVEPNQPITVQGVRPAHGVKGCPTCGKKCNQSRGNGATPDPKGSTSRDWYR